MGLRVALEALQLVGVQRSHQAWREPARQQAVEQAQRAFLAELLADTALSPADVVRTLWRRLADPALWPNERLFFELYALALQGRPGTAGLLDDIVDAWLPPTADYAVRRGLTPGAARADARLAVAVVRGLLLDLLATRDRPAVDAAMDRYIDLSDALAEHTAAGGGPQATPTRRAGTGLARIIHGE